MPFSDPVRLIKNEAGVSLLEALSAIGILSIATLSFISVFTTSQKVSKQTGHRAACQNYVQNTINKIQTIGTFRDMEPIRSVHWSGGGGLRVHSGNLSVGGDTEPGIQRAIRWPNNGRADLRVISGGRNYIRNSHLIHGSINGMLAIYNQNPALYCGAWGNYNYSPGTVTDKLLPIDGFGDVDGMLNMNARFKIRPYSQTTQNYQTSAGTAINCPTNLLIHPKGKNISGSRERPRQFWRREDVANAPIPPPVPANAVEQLVVEPTGVRVSHLIGGGLEVTVRVDYQDSEGSNFHCEAKTRLEYPDDDRDLTDIDPPPPFNWDAPFVVDNAHAFGVVSAGSSAPNCSPDRRNLTVRVGYDNNQVEEGSVVMCRSRSWRIGTTTDQLRTYTCLGSPGLPNIKVHKNVVPGLSPWQGLLNPPSHSTPGDYRNPLDAYTNISGGFGSWAGMNRPLAPKMMIAGHYPAITNQPWQPCNQIQVCGVNPSSATRQIIGNFYGWRLTFPNVPAGCTVNIDTVIVDPAGNSVVRNWRDNTGGLWNANQPWQMQNFKTFRNTVPFSTCGNFCGYRAAFGGSYFSCGICPP